MIIRLFVCAFLATLLISCLYSFVQDRMELVAFYEKNLRGNLFAGLLTVGGFLLSLKTFILIKLKDNVYDHDKYKELFNEQKKLDSTIKLYDPLKNLSDFLFWSVLSTISAAIAQLTIGLFGSYYLTLFAIWISAFALAILICSMFLIKSSLDDWFKFINHPED